MNTLKKLSFTIIFIIISVLFYAQSNIYVDYSKKGTDIPKSLYGIFFEEISHAGDGALYAELIQNRGFEEHVLPSGTTYRDGRAWAPSKPSYDNGQIKNFSVPWDTEKLKYTAWSLIKNKADASMVIAEEQSLHENTPHSMKIQISNMQSDGNVSFRNSGYWGVPVRDGETYKLRFYLRSTDYSGKVNICVVQGSTVMLQKEFDVDNSGEWKEYTAEVLAVGTTNTGTFQMNFSSNGTIWVDYVSLFPKKTFKNRENGFREDVAQILADINPAFVRWPGGCIVEGITIENRVRWKETIGDPMMRRGEWNRWGYRSTYGFGYHEFLQFCEDIGSDAMFVGNVGISCLFNNGDYVQRSELPAFIQDIRDAIEYAIGDVNTEWGAKRAENGHPEPFPLKYVELGNEQWGAFYPPIHDIFYNELKTEYPDITFISTLGIDLDAYNMQKADMIDPHYYKTSTWFFDSSHYWDKIKRKDYKVYVGEYACNQNVGAGHMEAALSEAAFMTGMERNADMVTMSSYAPLIENSNRRDWATNMIWVKNEGVVGRSSYYVQQMYANNLPDYNLSTNLILNQMTPVLQGRIGIGTWVTQADFKDFKITKLDGSKVFYDGKFSDNSADWKPFNGVWGFNSDGSYRQNSNGTRCISMMNKWMFNDCVIEVKAKKNSGNEGFLIILGAPKDNLNLHYQVNVGGWGNVQTAIEVVRNGVGEMISEPIPFKVKNNQWYDIKIVVRNGYQLDCYIDGEHVVGCNVNPTGKIQTIAGYDEKENETVIKVVNGTGVKQDINIVLNSKNIENNGKIITLSAPTLQSENSFINPNLIKPIETNYDNFSGNFTYSFKPASFTILRIKTDSEAGASINIPAWYSDAPIQLLNSSVNETKDKSDLTVYNSGNNKWLIEHESKTIERISILDINGKILFNKNNINDFSLQIDMNVFAKGLYIVKVVNLQGEYQNKKILII